MKILIINTQSINHNNATGITLRSIFQNFDPNDIYEFYLQPCSMAEDALSIRSKKIYGGVCPIRYFANKILGKRGEESASAAVGAIQRNPGIKKRAAMILDFEPIFIIPKIIKEIKQFSPDCIYTLGNGIDTMKLVYRLSKKLNLPVLPHFMDNWPASHRYGPDLFPRHLASTQKWLKKLYSRTQCGITISEKMAREYELRWNKKHCALMNTIQVSNFKCQIDQNKKILTFAYAGGLHLNRFKSLLVVAKAIDQYNTLNNSDLKFLLYTDIKSEQLYSHYFSETDCVTFCPSVSHNDIMKIYEQNDVLVHIETFDKEYREFIKYSLSTKISEYLATGKPILLYAPDDIFVYEYLKENDVAHLASAEKDLYNTIDYLLNGADLKLYSERSIDLAIKKHDIEYSQKVFNQALEYAVVAKD